MTKLTQARLMKDQESISLLEQQLNDINDEVEPSAFEVFPENFEATQIFLALCDQWRISQVGITGIDGNTVLGYLALYDYTGERKRELYQQIRLISVGAVNAWRDQAQQQ